MDIFQAAREGDLERVRALVEHNAGAVHATNEEEETPLVVAAREGHLEVLLYLLSADGDINHREVYGWTALHDACAEGHAEVASLLVQRGADVTAFTGDGFTALLLAALHCHDAVVLVLLKHGGSDVDAVRDNGETALHRACARNHAVVVRQLLEAGADATLRDAGGRTLVDRAAHHGRRDCVNIVQEWHRAYALYRARSVREASLVIGNSDAPVDAAPAYLVDRATSGLTMPTVHLSPHQQHGQQSDDVGEERHAEVGLVVVEESVAVYVIEELNGELFVELMELVGITGAV